MGDYPEHKVVKKCLQQIENQLNWGNSVQWHNEVFIELSEMIQQKTQVLLSPSTLKRVWGKVNYTSAPSISTLNTLALFAGYDNWRDFKNKNTKSKSRLSLPHSGIILTAAALLTVIFISLFSMINPFSTPPTSNISEVNFSSRPLTFGLPNSVVFDFDLHNVKSDCLYIQQSWDPTKTFKIQAEQKQATGIYYTPGYFRAKLLVDGQIVKEHDLFVKSDGWVATIDYSPIPKYVTNEQLVHGKLSLPPDKLEEIKSSITPLSSTFHLVEDFGNISGDNFSLQTTIRNTYQEKWAVCQGIDLIILGTEGAFIIPFSIRGCASNNALMLNDLYLDGKSHDLSAFSVDLSEYHKIDLEVRHKQVKISVDNEERFSDQYKNSIGRFVGLRYRFLGAGEVKYLSVEDDKGTSVFDEDFSNEAKNTLVK